ncbi:MAG: hypothetical protein WB992_13855 [Bryobacteraceae bacterium]
MKYLMMTMLAAALPLCLAVPMGMAQARTADISGTWHFVLQTDGGERVSEPTFQQNGDKVTGKWGTADVKGTFSDGKLNLEFPYNSDEAGAGKLKINGQLDGDVLTGEWGFQEYSGKFKATRSKQGPALP